MKFSRLVKTFGLKASGAGAIHILRAVIKEKGGLRVDAGTFGQGVEC